MLLCPLIQGWVVARRPAAILDWFADGYLARVLRLALNSLFLHTLLRHCWILPWVIVPSWVKGWLSRAYGVLIPITDDLYIWEGTATCHSVVIGSNSCESGILVWNGELLLDAIFLKKDWQVGIQCCALQATLREAWLLVMGLRWLLQEVCAGLMLVMIEVRVNDRLYRNRWMKQDLFPAEDLIGIVHSWEVLIRYLTRVVRVSRHARTDVLLQISPNLMVNWELTNVCIRRGWVLFIALVVLHIGCLTPFLAEHVLLWGVMVLAAVAVLGQSGAVQVLGVVKHAHLAHLYLSQVVLSI